MYTVLYYIHMNTWRLWALRVAFSKPSRCLRGQPAVGCEGQGEVQVVRGVSWRKKLWAPLPADWPCKVINVVVGIEFPWVSQGPTAMHRSTATAAVEGSRHVELGVSKFAKKLPGGLQRTWKYPHVHVGPFSRTRDFHPETSGSQLDGRVLNKL